MNSRDYWLKRETEALRIRITDEKEYQKEIQRIYQNMLDGCEKEIESFYAKYAKAEGISISAAKRRVAKHDVQAFERKAARYVKEKNFSKKANEELRLYNATMKINRLEMLKANIGLETIAGHDELDKFMAGILKGRTEDELRRQAGILGKTVLNNAEKANAIVNGSFKVAKVGDQSTFSDRIWQYQDVMRQDLGKLLQQGLVRGKGARELAKDLRQYWYGKDPKTGGGAKYCTERLMRTELARVQTEAQKQSYLQNGVEYYIFLANKHPSKHGTCEICKHLASIEKFKVEDMMPGDNAPPVHPHCRCSTAPYVDRRKLDEILDYVEQGGTYEEWNAQNADAGSKQVGERVTTKKKPLDQGVFTTYNLTQADSVRPKSVMNEMNKSNIGRSLMEYLEKNNVPVHLCYGVDNPKKNLGIYDPFDDTITIFCDVTKTTKETAKTLIHEATHRKLGSKGTFDEEVECFKSELIHQKGQLTKFDIDSIIEHVKKYYPELE